MEETRIGSIVSAQIGRMGVIEFSDGVFRLPNNSGFNIKNDGEEPVTLEVTLDKMAEGDFVETKFDTGWNPEIVRVVKEPASEVDIKYGI